MKPNSITSHRPASDREFDRATKASDLYRHVIVTHQRVTGSETCPQSYSEVGRACLPTPQYAQACTPTTSVTPPKSVNYQSVLQNVYRMTIDVPTIVGHVFYIPTQLSLN